MLGVQPTAIAERIINLIEEGESGPTDPPRWRNQSLIVLEEYLGAEDEIVKESKHTDQDGLLDLLNETAELVFRNTDEAKSTKTTRKKIPLQRAARAARWSKKEILKPALLLILVPLVAGCLNFIYKQTLGIIRDTQDDPSYVRLGAFSAGSGFFLFEEAGASGADHYSAIRIVRVSNHETTEYSKVQVAETPDAAQRKALDSFTPGTLTKYGFTESPGASPFAARQSDKRAFDVTIAQLVTRFELVQKDSVNDGCTPSKVKMFELRSINKNGEQMIQQDRQIPNSRQCANDYEVKGAYVTGNNVAVIIHVKSAEGMARGYRYIAATGTVK
jgi:predicted secreted protein